MNNDIVSPWTDKNLARWQRIAQHPFEDASAPLDFCAKLAREQGWSPRPGASRNSRVSALLLSGDGRQW